MEYITHIRIWYLWNNDFMCTIVLNNTRTAASEELPHNILHFHFYNYNGYFLINLKFYVNFSLSYSFHPSWKSYNQPLCSLTICTPFFISNFLIAVPVTILPRVNGNHQQMKRSSKFCFKQINKQYYIAESRSTVGRRLTQLDVIQCSKY